MISYVFRVCMVIFCLASGLMAGTRDYDKDPADMPTYALPEVLKTLNGNPVTTSEQWDTIRRPEILSLFEQNVFGQMPSVKCRVNYSIVSNDDQALNGEAVRQAGLVKVDLENGASISIPTVLFYPKKSRKKIPLFMLIWIWDDENFTTVDPFKSERWPVDEIIRRGCATVAFHVDSVAPDDKARSREGILGFLGGDTAASDRPGALSAWAWGASRMPSVGGTGLPAFLPKQPGCRAAQGREPGPGRYLPLPSPSRAT